MQRNLATLCFAIAFALSCGFAAAATTATTNNDDSCDVTPLPAATLLLPYFEVDIQSPADKALTTIFTVTNVTRQPQIARVTIWSDWGYPLLNFNIFLTGYDVQGINLYDVLVRGVIAPPSGTGNEVTPGERSADNGANPHFAPGAASACTELPGYIPASLLNDIRTALTTGISSTCGSTRIGGAHSDALGYVTVDVVATCGILLPTNPNYYLTDLLYDNALIGDYQQINPDSQTGNYASGNPMVHIRAIPEGGVAGSRPDTNLPYTFYDRYTVNAGVGVPRNIDRRQPLPSTFAARFVQGGTVAFNTNLQIWREGATGGIGSCSDYVKNSAMNAVEIVRFDEHEFPMTYFSGINISAALPPFQPTFPAASSTATSSSLYPYMTAPSADVAGWLYLNLNNGGSTAYSVTTNGTSATLPPTARDFRTNSSTTIGVRQSQNWVTELMYAEGRYSVGMDVLALANGCTPAPRVSDNGGTIGPPASNTNP